MLGTEHREATDEFFRKSKSTGGLLKRGMRARIYVRVSDTRNREETLISPEVQIGHCEEFAKREGLVLVGEPVQDLNLSGGSFAKRSVQKMIAEVDEGQYDVVIVWKWSRWGRHLNDSMINMALLDEVGGTLIAATEPVDVSTPTGKFSRIQFLAIAQLELDRIRESWRDAHRTRLRNGLPHSGIVPFGYEYHPDELDPAKKYTAHPVEFPLLKEMYTSYLAGKSPRTIAMEFNARGLKARKGGPFRPSTIRTSMQSGFGAGRITYGDYEAFSDLWPLAITGEEWEQYLARKAEKRVMHPRRAGQIALAKGLVFCGLCGSQMSLQRVKSKKGGKVYQYDFYRCAGPGEFKCKGVNASETTVNAKITTWLTQMVKGGDDSPEMLARKMRAERAESNAKVIEKDIAHYKALMQRGVALVIEGTLTSDDFKATKAEYEREIANLEVGLQQARTEATVNFVPPREVFGTLLMAIEAGMDTEGLNHTLQPVIKKIVVRKAERGSKALERLVVIPGWEDEPPALTQVS